MRSTLLELTRDFVLVAGQVPGVLRIAMLGSLLTTKARPKDVDILVTIADDISLATLARLGRRLKGRAQSTLNSGADVFLARADGSYLGRVCHYRECHPRVLCRARNCGTITHLADDLDVVTLPAELIAAPPLELFPKISARVSLPEDVVRRLVDPLQGESPFEP